MTNVLRWNIPSTKNDENFYFRFQVDVLKHLDERIMKVTSSGALLRQNVYYTTQNALDDK